MVQLQKILGLINAQNWDQLTRQFDLLLGVKQSGENRTLWIEDCTKQKIAIIDLLQKKLQTLRLTCIDAQHEQNLHNLEQTTLKLFSKGLILPQLNHYEDILLLHKLINSSKSTKYLFMLYQENIYQINQIYHQQSISIYDKVNLKSLSLISSFIKLAGQNIFQDVVKRFHEFYTSYRKIAQEQNVIGQPDKELEGFFNHFAQASIQQLSILIINFNTKDFVKKFTQKQDRRKQLFQLMRLLFTHHPTYSFQIRSLVDKIVMKLQLGLREYQEIPSFWIRDHVKQLDKIYSSQQLFIVIGTVLIRQLPSRPEYSQIPHHLLDLLQWIVVQLLSLQFSIKSLTLGNNDAFFIQFFERLAILMGLLNSYNKIQKQINQMIKNLFNKKDLFESVYFVEILWRRIINEHQDANFKMFCLGQYKKVFLLTVKQVGFVEMNVLKSGSQLMLKLVSQLQGNSNAEYIGFVLTLLIYYFSFLKKTLNYCSNSSISLQNSKKQAVMMYVFGSLKILLIKQEIKTKLFKLKESLKDRLQVLKMKITNERQDTGKIQKQTNQISICIYRIEQEIKFD